jgi:hypothetical protein
VRNALIPVVTLVALQMPAVFGGAIVTEQIFRVPGIGSLLISAILANDTPVIMAVTFVFACLVILFNLIADILYGWLDPASATASAPAPRPRPAPPAARGVAALPQAPARGGQRRHPRRHGPRRAGRALHLAVPIDEIDFTARLQGPSWRIPSAPTTSARTCSRACSMAGASRSRSASRRCWSRSSSACWSARSPACRAASVDAALMWLTDLFLSLPQLPLLLLIIYLFRDAEGVVGPEGASSS